MSKRSEIIDGQYAESRKSGPVYTRLCDWIDLAAIGLCPASAAPLDGLADRRRSLTLGRS